MSGFTVEVTYTPLLNKYIFKKLLYSDKQRYIISTKTLVQINEYSNFKHIENYVFNLLLINKEILNEVHSTPTFIIGGWYNKEKDIYLIEYNIASDNKATALILGNIYKQEYIFDNKTKQCIKVFSNL
jgi:hypothetical protein